MKIATWLREDISIAKGAMRISITGQVEKYRKEYEEALKTHREFKYQVYRVNDRRLVHVKIPSSVEGMNYDVVIEFMSIYPEDLERSDIHVFSNSPAFVFTSAFALLSYGDFVNTGRLLKRGSIRRGTDCQIVDGLETKLSEKALMNPPDTRNPTQIAIPDKTVYWGIFYILDHVPPEEILAKGINTSIGRVAASVLSFEEAMQLRRRLDKAHKDERKNRYNQAMSELENEERKQERARSRGLQKLNGPKSPLKPKMAMSAKSTSKTRSVKSTRRGNSG